MSASFCKCLPTQSLFSIKFFFLILTLAFFLSPALLLAAEFDGYPCLMEDCSGHQAGYEWAEKHNITDPDHCGGKSQSFIEGCRAYASGGSGHITDEYEQEEYQWE